MSSVPANLCTKYGLNMSEDRGVIDVSLQLPCNLVTIATRYVVDAYRPIEPPYKIWVQYALRQRSYRVKYI